MWGYDWRERIGVCIVIIFYLLIFVAVGLFIRDVAKSRLGQKIEYWMSEPNDRG